MTILEALRDKNLFGGLPVFRDLSTWRAWLVFLAAVYGRPFRELVPLGVTEADALALFIKHTGRTCYAPPVDGYPEAVTIAGRQSGKDRIGSVIQDYEAISATREADGSDIYALSIAQDGRASLRTQLSYARAPFRRLPMLKALVMRSRTNELELSTGVTLAAYPCRPAAVRGLRARVVVMSEIAFYRSTEGNPVDVEMLRAVRPTLATTGGRLVILSSPYGAEGALYDLHRKYFGRDDAPVLVWQATAPEMNPTLSVDYLTRMEQDDPDAYLSEVLGEFRLGVSTLHDGPTLFEAVESGVRERAAVQGTRYVADTDAASGTATAKDAWGLGIAHREGDRVILDVTRAWKPPFNPSNVVAEIATLLRSYRITSVSGDRYAPGFVDEAFRAQGIKYEQRDRDTSTVLLDLVPLVNAGRVVLLDNDELLRELRNLERRRGQSGRDRAGHRPGGHDDRACAAAGALTALANKPIQSGGQYDLRTGRLITGTDANGNAWRDGVMVPETISIEEWKRREEQQRRESAPKPRPTYIDIEIIATGGRTSINEHTFDPALHKKPPF